MEKTELQKQVQVYIKKYVLNSEIIKYIFSGITTFIIENLAFLVAFYAMGLNAVSSNMISIFMSAIYNFSVSKYFVFSSTKKKGRTGYQAVYYGVLVLSNAMISTLIIKLLIEEGLDAYIVKPLVTLVIVSWTFFVYKFIIFKK